MAPLFHITTALDWRQARAAGVHRPASLAREGFIHLSERGQLLRTANRWFRGSRGLLLLAIDRDAVSAHLRFEESEPGEHFPPLYAELRVEAVVGVSPFEPDADGVFRALPSVATGPLT